MDSLLELYDKGNVEKIIQKPQKDPHYAKWFIENLKLQRCIGTGTFSKVYLASNKNNEECALKIIDNLDYSEAIDYQKRLVVASNLCSTRSINSNVVGIKRFEDRLVGKGNTKVHQIVIIMERVATSLHDLHKEKIKAGQSWTQDNLIKFLLAMTNALMEGSKRELFHFDIHDRNIFVEAENGVFLLGDFGVPKIVKKRNKNQPYQSDFLAPEAAGIYDLKNAVDLFKADVYSLGLVALKLMSMRESFKMTDRHEIQKILLEKKEEYPLITKILGEQMLIEKPEKRESSKNVRYFLLTVNFELAFSSYNMDKNQVIKKNFGTNHMEYIEDFRELIDIAQTYEYFKLYSTAISEYNKVMNSIQRHDDYTKDFTQVRVFCLERIGIVHMETKDYTAAMNIFNKLKEYLHNDSVRYLLGDEHPLYINVYHYIGVAYYRLGNLDEAMATLKEGHELGKDHASDSELNCKIRELYMGVTKFLKNEFFESLEGMLGISDFLTTLPQKDYSENAESLIMIAEYYRNLKAYNESLQVYTKARDLIKKIDGEDSSEYIAVMREVANAQKLLKDLKGACSIQLNLLEKIRQSGDKHLFADALIELADTLVKQEKISEAIYTAEMAFKVFNKIYWLKHEKTVKAFKYLMELVAKSPNKNILKQYKVIEDMMQTEVRGTLDRRNKGI